jgi:hypothetical protein
MSRRRLDAQDEAIQEVTMSTDPRGPHRVRASDAEREQYAQILRAAMSEGRLTLEEGEERLGQVYAAKYRDELSPLAADLPDGGRQAIFDPAEARATCRKMISRHAGLAAVITGALVALWALSGAHFFWPLVPLLFVWFGVLRHLGWRRWQSGSGPTGWGGSGGWGPGPGWGGSGGWGHGRPPWTHSGAA